MKQHDINEHVLRRLQNLEDFQQANTEDWAQLLTDITNIFDRLSDLDGQAAPHVKTQYERRIFVESLRACGEDGKPCSHEVPK